MGNRSTDSLKSVSARRTFPSRWFLVLPSGTSPPPDTEYQRFGGSRRKAVCRHGRGSNDDAVRPPPPADGIGGELRDGQDRVVVVDTVIEDLRKEDDKQVLTGHRWPRPEV